MEKKLIITCYNPKTSAVIGTKMIDAGTVFYREWLIARAVISILTRKAMKSDISAIVDTIKSIDSNNDCFDFDDYIDYINSYPDIFYFVENGVDVLEDCKSDKPIVTVKVVQD